MSFDTYIKREKILFGTDLRGETQVCQKVEVVM